MLKALATSDYLNAQWQPVPERYQSKLVNTQKNETTSFSGVIHATCQWSTELSRLIKSIFRLKMQGLSKFQMSRYM